MLRQRDVALAEAQRTREQLVTMSAAIKSLEERVAYLDTTLEKLHNDRLEAQAAAAAQEATLRGAIDSTRREAREAPSIFCAAFKRLVNLTAKMDLKSLEVAAGQHPERDLKLRLNKPRRCTKNQP